MDKKKIIEQVKQEIVQEQERAMFYKTSAEKHMRAANKKAIKK